MTDARGEKKKTGLIVGVILVLMLAIVLVSVRITEISVTGNERYTDEQMTEILFPDQVSRIPIVCYLKDRFQEHETIPFVEDYKIVFFLLLLLQISPMNLEFWVGKYFCYIYT